MTLVTSSSRSIQREFFYNLAMLSGVVLVYLGVRIFLV
jgi:hypothetical protein